MLSPWIWLNKVLLTGRTLTLSGVCGCCSCHYTVHWFLYIGLNKCYIPIPCYMLATYSVYSLGFYERKYWVSWLRDHKSKNSLLNEYVWKTALCVYSISCGQRPNLASMYLFPCKFNGDSACCCCTEPCHLEQSTCLGDVTNKLVKDFFFLTPRCITSRVNIDQLIDSY